MENVGQGSRQNRLVTLEEELALWGEWQKPVAAAWLRDLARLGCLTRATERAARLGWALRLRRFAAGGFTAVCHNERPAQNCNSQRKSDSLIETKQSDSPKGCLRFVNSAQCFDCYCDENHISASKQRE